MSCDINCTGADKNYDCHIGNAKNRFLVSGCKAKCEAECDIDGTSGLTWAEILSILALLAELIKK